MRKRRRKTISQFWRSSERKEWILAQREVRWRFETAQHFPSSVIRPAPRGCAKIVPALETEAWQYVKLRQRSTSLARCSAFINSATTGWLQERDSVTG